MIRIGHGFDVHAFDKSKAGPIAMGGIQIPYQYDFLAHSDGDVLLHAICDALLGALALGDIGKHFPDTDPKFYKIDSKELLKLTYQLILEHGYQLINLDATIMAQAPKFAPHIVAMRECIAQQLAVELGQISVKATTTEKLGFTGRSEGIAVEAVVLLESISNNQNNNQNNNQTNFTNQG